MNITKQNENHEPRKVEDELRLHSQILENLAEGVYLVKTADLTIAYTNPKFEEMFGYGPGEMLGQHVGIINAPTDVDPKEVAQRIEADLKAEGVWSGNVHNKKKDGTLFWSHVNISEFDHPEFGKVWLSIQQDIDARMKAEAALLEAKSEAEKANKAKSEFLASMSHELRTPLNAVLGFAQILQTNTDDSLSGAQMEHIQHILDGGNHLLELVNQVLDLARIEAGQAHLCLEEVKTNEVVADCVAFAIPLGQPRGIKIIDHFSCGPLSHLRTDPLRLKQVLLNLLSNAVRYNKDGGKVTVDGQETSNAFLRLSVSDTGAGIAKEEHSKVFRRFRQIKAAPTIANEGTGIGLYVTKLLVELMAGRIGFESEEGVGSTFWIELPLASNEETLIWDDNVRIGIDAIDNDHQILVSLLNKVTQRSVDDADLYEVVTELIDYTHYHFQREEAIMEVCGYPHLEEHRSLHQDLAAQVNDLARTWRERQAPERLDHLRKFLRDLLFDHIMKFDAELSHYAKGRHQEIRKALEGLD